jgi:hypothetical protein
MKSVRSICILLMGVVLSGTSACERKPQEPLPDLTETTAAPVATRPVTCMCRGACLLMVALRQPSDYMAAMCEVR